MKILTAISACALLATAIPAFSQASNPGATGGGTNNSTGGNPGATGGTDPKYGNGGVTEGRSSAPDDNMQTGGSMRKGSRNNAIDGNSNGNMAPGGGPGIRD